MLTTENICDRIIMSSFSMLSAGSIFASYFVSWHAICRMCQSPELKPAVYAVTNIIYIFLFSNSLPILSDAFREEIPSNKCSIKNRITKFLSNIIKLFLFSFLLKQQVKSDYSSHKAVFTSGKRLFLYEIGTDPVQGLLETTYIFQRKQEQQYDPVTRFIKPCSVYHKNTTCFILHSSLICCIVT